MKLTVLCDNNTFIDNYLYGEPALSFYIENEDDRILFDLGYSNVFVKNAEIKNIDLKKVNKIVFSHGHDDHTRGIKYFNFEKGTKIIHGPKCFEEKFIGDLNISVPYSKEELSKKFEMIESKEPIMVSKNIYFLGTIPRVTKFETANLNLKTKENGDFVVDKFEDDSALVYDIDKGIFIIAGCSHSGICNICEYAKKLFNKKIIGIIGGFHLLQDNEQSIKTVEYLKKQNIENLYPCHCTSLHMKARMINEGLNVLDVGSGLELVF